MIKKNSLLFTILALFVFVLPANCNTETYKEVLANGVTVFIKNTMSSPTVSLNVFIKVGGFEETDDTMGISHFYEHLFFRGTPSLSSKEFKRSIEGMGGSTNASTNRDFTQFFINLPKRYARDGIKLLADALINAQLDPESIDQERKAVLEEYKIGLESPGRIINTKISQMAYGNHPYARPVIGDVDNISNFAREDFLRFRNTFYTPERTTVVIVGDVRPSEILPCVEEAFGQFQRGSQRPVLRAGKVKIPTVAVTESESLPSNNSFVVLAYVGPSVKDRPDIYQVDVMSFLLGVGRGSLLKREIVEKEKAIDGGLEFQTQRFQGLITLYAISPVGGEERLREDLLSVIEEVKKGNFTDKDLQRAKNFLKSNYLLGGETNSGKAESLGFYASIDEASFINTYLKEIDKVTREDVIKAANKYLGSGYYCLKLLGKAKKTQEELEEEQRVNNKRQREDRRSGSSWRR